MSKKQLYLIASVLTGVVCISSFLDAEPPSTFGSPWIFRIGMLILSMTSLSAYFKIRKNEKEYN